MGAESSAGDAEPQPEVEPASPYGFVAASMGSDGKPSWWAAYKREGRADRAAQRKEAAEAAAPAPPRYINVELRLTPEQYQLLQAAETTVRRTERGRLRREEVIAEICRRVVDGKAARRSARQRAATQLVVHLDAATEQAWIDSDRGPREVDAATLESALAEGQVIIQRDGTPEDDEPRQGATEITESADSTVEQTSIRKSTEIEPAFSPEPSAVEQHSARKPSAVEQLALLKMAMSGTPRPPIPMAVLRTLYARANGACEVVGCGRREYLHVHHRKPWSRGGKHDLANLELRCAGCHGQGHTARG